MIGARDVCGVCVGGGGIVLIVFHFVYLNHEEQCHY